MSSNLGNESLRIALWAQLSQARLYVYDSGNHAADKECPLTKNPTNYPRSLNLRCVTSVCCGWFHVVCLNPIAIPMADWSWIRIISIQRNFSDSTKFRFISDLRTQNPWQIHGTSWDDCIFTHIQVVDSYGIKYGSGKYTALVLWKNNSYFPWNTGCLIGI